MKIKGEVAVKANYRIATIRQEMEDSYRDLFGDNWQTILCKASRYLEKKVLEGLGCRVFEGHNIVPNYLRFEMASLIAGNTVTPTFKANYIALGTDATVASNGDLKLYAETIRRVFSNKESSDNVALLDRYFESFEVGGNTYREVGIFCDGTSVADTGYLLSRIVINETIASNEALICNVSFTIS